MQSGASITHTQDLNEHVVPVIGHVAVVGLLPDMVGQTPGLRVETSESSGTTF